MPSQKSVAFLYANSEQSEKELKKVISFTVSTHKIRYSEINLTKEAKDLYNENYKTLKKEIEENTHTHTHTQRKRKIFCVRRLENQYCYHKSPRREKFKKKKRELITGKSGKHCHLSQKVNM